MQSNNEDLRNNTHTTFRTYEGKRAVFWHTVEIEILSITDDVN